MFVPWEHVGRCYRLAVHLPENIVQLYPLSQKPNCVNFRRYNAKPGIKHMPKYAEIGMKSQVAGRLVAVSMLLFLFFFLRISYFSDES